MTDLVPRLMPPRPRTDLALRMILPQHRYGPMTDLVPVLILLPIYKEGKEGGGGKNKNKEGRGEYKKRISVKGGV